MIIAAALFIRLFDELNRYITVYNAMAAHDTVDAFFNVRIDENANYIITVIQYIVGTATYNYTVFLFSSSSTAVC